MSYHKVMAQLLVGLWFDSAHHETSGYPVYSANQNTAPIVIPACRWAGIHATQVQWIPDYGSRE